MTNYSTKDLGKVLGEAIKNSDSYRQDFIQSEDVTDINIVGVETITANQGSKVTKKFVIGCSTSGVNGGKDPFVLDHPVNGNLDSSDFYIDGDYCSSTLVYDDTGDL